MKQLWMDWQTFAEAAEASQETGGETGGQAAPDAGEQEAFSALIRGQYKEQFDARVQKILDGRLRGLRQENARLRQEVQARRVPGRCGAAPAGGGGTHPAGVSRFRLAAGDGITPVRAIGDGRCGRQDRL